MDKLKRVVIFLAAFVLSKGVTFLTPIIVSNIASVEEYGLVEYALSLGFMLSAPISLGFHGAYPYFNLKLQKEGYRSLYEAHCLFIFAIAVFFIFAYLGNGRPVFLGISIGVIVAIQMIKSSIQKTHERIQIASVLDSGIYYAVSFFVLGLYLFNKSFRTSDLVIPLGLYLLLLFFWSLKDFLKTKKDWGFARYKDSMYFGIPLVISGFLINSFIMGGRIIVEFFLGIEQVAYYGFYFRLASAIAIIHQIINIAFFKKIYQSKAKQLDKYFSLLLYGLLAMSIILWWLVPLLLSTHLDVLNNTYAEQKWLYFIFSFMTVIWISMALNENIVYREKLAPNFNKRVVFVILTLGGTFFSIDYWNGLNLEIIAILLLLGIYGVCEVQLWLLRKKREIVLTKLTFANRLTVAVFLLVYFLK